MRTSGRTLSGVLAALLLTTAAHVSSAEVTPFGREVNDAIDAGIAWLASVQNADGSWGSGGTRWGTGACVLDRKSVV